MNKWVVRKKQGNIKLLCETMGVSKLTAQILINRGLLKEDKIEDFLNTDISRFHDFKKAYGVVDGINIIKESVANNEKITIYGDYDVDGVTSTTILYKTLSKITDNVYYFLPNRHKDGYGLNIDSINMLVENGTKLIITCDNGIASQKENDYIQQKGLKHIVIDHHEEPLTIDNNLKSPNAIVDPKQSKCNYLFKEMCAAGLSYRFCCLLLDEYNIAQSLKDELLVFAMIGTICDIVPLMSDNRIIVKEGLALLNSNKEINSGVAQILRNKDCFDKTITPYTIGFIVGPTINSAGRLAEGIYAVELFTTDDNDRIEEIGTTLYELNSKRQELTKMATEELLQIVESTILQFDKVIVAHVKECDEAVAGIVSGRIKEKYNKPTIVVTGEGEILKGSCRSTDKYNMHTELSKLSDYFIKFGGHKMAAGFSIYANKFDEFKKQLLENCTLTDDDLTRIIAVDDIVNLADVSFKEATQLDILKPYGEGNKEPLFASTKVHVKSIRIYEEKNTLILGLSDENDEVLVNAITFSLLDKFKMLVSENFEPFIANKLLNGITRDIDLIVDLVYYISINEYNGKKSVQLKIEDMRYSS